MCSISCRLRSHHTVRDACEVSLHACAGREQRAYAARTWKSFHLLGSTLLQPRLTAVLTNLSAGSRRPSCCARSGRCQAVSPARPDRQLASEGRQDSRNWSVFMGEDADAASKEIVEIQGKERKTDALCG